MKFYTLFDLPSKLPKLKIGDELTITGQQFCWQFTEENKKYFFLKNKISNQKILIVKQKL